jgi:hypothetical protein
VSAAKDVCERTLSQRNTPIWSSYVNMLKTLVSVFPSNRHWILEFVQNAEDAKSTRFLIRLRDGVVEVLNDGDLFTADDVETISSVKSRKNPALGLRGYLGIGFKSVYRASGNVEVHSGEQHFCFNRDFWSNERRSGVPIWEWPWEVLPLDADTSPPPPPFRTQFRFGLDPTASPEDASALQEFLTPEKFPAELILLLDRIQTIEIEGPTISFAIRANRLSKESMGEGWIEQVEVSKGATSSPDRYLLFRRTVTVPNRIRTDPETLRVRRAGVENREVGVFFRIDENGRLTQFSGMIGGVYSFAPLENEVTGLPFGIFGDFLSHPSRDVINYRAAWNVWVRTEVSRLLGDVLGGPIAQNDDWWRFAPDILEKVIWPLTGPGAEFWNPLREEIRVIITSRPIVRDTAGEPHPLNELVYAPSRVINELGWDTAVQMLGPHRAIAQYDVGSALQRIRATGKLQIEPLFTTERVSDQLRAHPETAPSVYRALRHRDADTSALGGSVPILSHDGEIRRAGESVAVSIDLEQLPGWLKEIAYTNKVPIDPRVTKDEKTVAWLQLRGLDVVNFDFVLNRLSEKLDSITGLSECPGSWSFPEDVIEATLYLLSRRDWWSPEHFVAGDGTILPAKRLFLAGGQLDWSHLWKAKLLPTCAPLDEGYVTDVERLNRLGIDRAGVLAHLQRSGIHGFDPKDDKELTEDCAYNLFSDRASRSGHVLGPKQHRRDVGYDFACIGHCNRVFESKGMHTPGDVEFLASEYAAARSLHDEGRGGDYVLVCVYDLPCQPENVGYREIPDPFTIADPPHGDSIIRREKWSQVSASRPI